MHPADINAALLKAGANQTRIAERFNVSCNAVSSVIHGRMKSHRLANAISKITGIPVNSLWPGKYVRRQKFKLAA